MYLLLILSIIHLPVYYIGDDSIGVFDFAVLLISLNFSLRTLKLRKNRCDLILLYSLFLFCCVFSTYFLENLDNKFHYLLIAKQFEFVLIWIAFHNLIKRNSDPVKFNNFILLCSYIVSIYGMISVYEGTCYRLCLINKMGDSPNPAGFILAISIIFLYLENKINKLFLIVPFVALLMTLSRTNFIALFATFILITILNKNFKNFLYLFVILIISYLSSFYQNQYHLPLFEYVKNPLIIINDPSLKMRFDGVWWIGIKYDIVNILLGSGFGNSPVNDSLYTRLFIGVGAFGLMSYLLFCARLALISRKHFILVFFVLVNGVAVETVINSYRTVQFLIPLIVYLIIQNQRERWLKFSPMVPTKTA